MNTDTFPGVTVVRHPLVQARLTTLRDSATPPYRFRETLASLAPLLLFEATRGLDTAPDPIQTPLAPTEGHRLARPLIVVPILRAGLGLADAMLRLLPEASVGHIGMARDESTFRPASYYNRLPPNPGNADILLVDPMLATGHSAAEAVTTLKSQGARSIVFICVVSCPEGLTHLTSAHPGVPIVTAAIDSHLNEKAYIVPGLGDAGDRYFGTT